MDEQSEWKPEPSAPVKRRLSSEMLIALSAVTVSILTLAVYIVQARIMMDQQHTSVWPYVEWTTTYSSADTQEFYIEVINKGVGPALVKETRLYLDDSLYSINDYAEFMKRLIGQENRDALWVMYSNVDNRVMAPGEVVRIFDVKNWRDARIPTVDIKRIKYTVCYCSIYDDCWTTDGTVSKEGSCE